MLTISKLFILLFAIHMISNALDFTGLERLYFVKINNENLNGTIKDKDLDYYLGRIRNYLPVSLKGTFPIEKVILDEHDQEIIIHDNEISLKNNPKEKLIIREICDKQHPRFYRTFWALYEHGKRRSLWFYNPLQRSGDFIISLANIEPDFCAILNDTLIKITIKGEQFLRGHWLMRSTSLFFCLKHDSLSYKYAINNFYYSEGETLEIETETEDLNGIIRKTVINPDSELLQKSGYESPLLSDSLTWEHYREIAKKITSDSNAVQTFRRKDEPLYFEKR